MNRISVLLLIILIVALTAAGTAAWVVLGGNTPSFEGEREVRIPRGSSFEVVTDSLVSAGILRNPSTFRLVARATRWDGQMKAGYYRFSSGASNWTMLNRLRRGLQDFIRVTVPPGTRPGVVAAIVRRDLDIDSTAFRQALVDPEFSADLGTDTLHLFASLLPETYHFYWTTDERTVIRRMNAQFRQLFDEDLESNREALGLTQDEIVRLASIVEWEARIEDEKARIAGVYINRLRMGMPLQADPTVQYALMQSDGGTLRRLVFRDYEIDHPFNTYRFAGLPPGPITNPGPSTIRAVLDHEEHDYLYMVADGSGRHTFSRTFEEHTRAAQQYRNMMRERRANGGQTGQ